MAHCHQSNTKTTAETRVHFTVCHCVFVATVHHVVVFCCCCFVPVFRGVRNVCDGQGTRRDFLPYDQVGALLADEDEGLRQNEMEKLTISKASAEFNAKAADAEAEVKLAQEEIQALTAVRLGGGWVGAGRGCHRHVALRMVFGVAGARSLLNLSRRRCAGPGTPSSP